MWQAVVEVAAICLLAMLLAISGGCSPTVRIEFSCVSQLHESGTMILTDCGDPQSWKDWAEKQAKETKGSTL